MNQADHCINLTTRIIDRPDHESPRSHLEQRHVVAEEFAQVHVHDGAQHQHKLVLCGETPLQVARRAQHRHHGAHA